MIGRRVYPDNDGVLHLRKGDYGINQPNGIWYSRTPNGLWGNLGNHEVVEHEDSTITVSPSILVTGYDYDLKESITWHGFLERGVWREV